jgi:hypothetical protein
MRRLIFNKVMFMLFYVKPLRIVDNFPRVFPDLFFEQ